MRFGRNMQAWARLNAARGGRTFHHRFAQSPPGETGASHGAEMRRIYEHLDREARPWTDEDRAPAESMASCWTKFAKTGDPDREGLGEWPAFSVAEPSALHLGDDYRTGRVSDERELKAIDRLYAAVRFALSHGLQVSGGLAPFPSASSPHAPAGRARGHVRQCFRRRTCRASAPAPPRRSDAARPYRRTGAWSRPF